MINWILIVVLVLAAFLIIRFMFSRHAKHRFMFTIIMSLILLFFFTFYFVSSVNNVDITSLKGIGQGFALYGVWIVHSFDNVRSMTGYAVSLDWKGNNTVNADNVNTNTTPKSNGIVETGKNVGQQVVNVTVNTVDSVIVKPNTPKKIVTYK